MHSPIAQGAHFLLLLAVYHLKQTVDHVKIHVKKDKGKAVGTRAHVLALKPLGKHNHPTEPKSDKIKQHSNHKEAVKERGHTKLEQMGSVEGDKVVKNRMLRETHFLC